MFAHLYGADRVWLSRGTGACPSRLTTATDFGDLSELRRRWDELELEQQAFVEGRSAADLERERHHRNTAGERFRLSLWRLLQHIPNHATHQRSEIATMMTMISGSPPYTSINTDLASATGQG